MRQIVLDDYVRLNVDIPELALRIGQIGIVRGRQPGADSSAMFEVEFHQIGHDYQLRALLSQNQLRVEDGALGDRP